MQFHSSIEHGMRIRLSDGREGTFICSHWEGKEVCYARLDDDTEFRFYKRAKDYGYKLIQVTILDSEEK